MANKAKRKVRETFTTVLRRDYFASVCPRLKETRIADARFNVGDRVRVTVELLERRKRKGGK